MEELISKGVPLRGDAILYWGLFRALGDTSHDELLRQSMDEDGRLWRNPERLIPHTSRDMMLGLMVSGRSGQQLQLYRYLSRSGWKLSPTSPDRRHHVGLLGRIQLSALVRRGHLKRLKPLLPLFLLLSCVSPLKKPFEMHLDICTLLLYGIHFKWGTLNTLLLEASSRVLNYLSPANALLQYWFKDTEALDKIRLGLLWEKSNGCYHDHWCFASFEPWRDARMAHPACLAWVELAMRKLKEDALP